ncbi:hypothetical protein C3R30_21200, partial [Mycobacterium tuberculosis]
MPPGSRRPPAVAPLHPTAPPRLGPGPRVRLVGVAAAGPRRPSVPAAVACRAASGPGARVVACSVGAR